MGCRRMPRGAAPVGGILAARCLYLGCSAFVTFNRRMGSGYELLRQVGRVKEAIRVCQLATPLALYVEIQAIGRGMTRPMSSL